MTTGRTACNAKRIDAQQQIELERATWGDLSEEIRDYSALDLPARLGTQRGRELLSIVDPYSYRERLTAPKLILLGTNDRYWPLDALTLYETRGLEAPLHYTVRVARWDQDRAWELQFLHHKLYLRNRPTQVDALSVSHGFNIVALNRAFAANRWRFRIGLGPVIAHPEAQIGGVSYDGPYELAGVAGLGGVGTTLALTPNVSILGEITATFGYVEVHPHGNQDLTFSIRNPAIHAQLGLGYRF